MCVSKCTMEEKAAGRIYRITRVRSCVKMQIRILAEAKK